MSELPSQFINTNIVISKEIILQKHNTLDIFFKNCIKALYNNPTNEQNETVIVFRINPNSLINPLGNNNLKLLAPCSKKAGVYIFLNEEGMPKYIGKGGTSLDPSEKSKDLKFRISQELGTGNEHNTLSNNIIMIDSILENRTVTEQESKDKILSLSLFVIIVGDRLLPNSAINLDAISKSEKLETLLVSMYNSTYNK